MASAIVAMPLAAGARRGAAAAARPRPAARRALAPQSATLRRPSRVAATPADDVASPNEVHRGARRPGAPTRRRRRRRALNLAPPL
jgi:hypothetical protein